MKYLMEREAAYDTAGIGFPSIQGCLAVAYQTQSGLFGFHNAGNSHKDKFDARAKKFAEWVRGHPHGGDAGVCLYGVSFVRSNHRGYSHPPHGLWKEEMKTFAFRLGFRGTILGYDLTLTWSRQVSAYVEIAREHGGFSMFVKEWNKDTAGQQKDRYQESVDFKDLDWNAEKAGDKQFMTIGLDRSGLTRVFPERL